MVSDSLELTLFERFSGCAEFTDMESLSSVRRVYEPNDPTATVYVNLIVNIVEDPRYWGNANQLINSQLTWGRVSEVNSHYVRA